MGLRCLLLAADVELRMNHLGQIGSLLSGVKYSGSNQMHGPMNIGGNDRVAGLRDHFRETEKKCDASNMDDDRRQSHRDKMARGDRLGPKKEVQFGRSFGGYVYARHAVDIQTLLLCPRLLVSA